MNIFPPTCYLREERDKLNFSYWLLGFPLWPPEWMSLKFVLLKLRCACKSPGELKMQILIRRAEILCLISSRWCGACSLLPVSGPRLRTRAQRPHNHQALPAHKGRNRKPCKLSKSKSPSANNQFPSCSHDHLHWQHPTNPTSCLGKNKISLKKQLENLTLRCIQWVNAISSQGFLQF